MERLSDAQLAKRDALVEALERAAVAVQEANATYNQLLVQQVWPFVQEIIDTQRSYHDEQPEDWQESEAGQAYAAWRDAFEDTMEVGEISFGKLEDPEHANILADLPEAPQ